jgi:hypothetical protein
MGLISDIQFADIENGQSFDKTENRYYRNAVVRNGLLNHMLWLLHYCIFLHYRQLVRVAAVADVSCDSVRPLTDSSIKCDDCLYYRK